jgi:dihydroorotate dehydrogenase electron transfer subunit
MYQEKATIIKNEKINNHCWRMVICSKYIAKKAQPGQFLHIKVNSNNGKPFLRRPFAIHNVGSKGQFSILYKIRGQATKLMRELSKADKIDVIGPLGSGFQPSLKAKKYIIVAGGIGLAPLFFLAKNLLDSKKEVIVIYGARTKKELLCRKEISNINIKPLLATDDGSQGTKGSVNDLLTKLLAKNKDEKIEVFAAGPRVMLKEAARICKKAKVKLEVSMDEIMACGVGVCLGCAVKTKNGYKLACKDGPVFKAEDIIWE